MRFEAIEPATVDQATAAAMAELVNAATASDAPHLSPVTARHEQSYAQFGWENRPPDTLILARDDRGRVRGRVYVELPRHDNLDLGVLGVECHPDERGGPLPDQLLAEGLDGLRAAGRTGVLVDAWSDGFWSDFYVRAGFEVGLRSAHRRLWMSRLDWPTLDQLHAESLERSAGYDVVEVPIPAPDDLMAGLVGLHVAMNDAPNDDLDIEDEVWDVARARAFEQCMLNRGFDVVRLVAVRRSDGVLGGFTVMVLEDERPTLGFQEDTGVVGEHRGHRIGIRLKVEMLQLMRDRHPQVEQIDTWNAESNGPMIAVNDALGCQVLAHGVNYQRSVDG